MGRKKKILIVFGTRPEAIKMAPLVKEFERQGDKFETIVCVTAQHRQMLDQVLNLFNITPYHDLDLMTKNQTLAGLTTRVLMGVTEILEKENPDLVFVQGDTTTSFVAALAAFYQKVPVAHLEAGLRTYKMYNPFPEEINRTLTSSLAHLHFAPTQESMQNLINEGISEDIVYITGNTVIDALKWVVKKQEKEAVGKKWQDFFKSEFDISFDDSKKTVLITGHRRESFGDGFIRICEAIKTLANNNPEIQIIYPVHLNPNVQKPVYSILGDINNVYLTEPVDYEPFVYLMNKSYIILTDSGGVQEEAPSLAKPVLVLRDTTERPEGVEAGTTKLVGTNTNVIIAEAEKLLFDKKEYNKMSKAINPYGDGKTSEMIVNIVSKTLFGEIKN